MLLRQDGSTLKGNCSGCIPREFIGEPLDAQHLWCEEYLKEIESCIYVVYGQWYSLWATYEVLISNFHVIDSFGYNCGP